MARQFREVWQALEISFDDFIQTSEERHQVGCHKFIQAVYDAGDIYKKAYTGLYCNGCEAFKTEKELVDGRCPNHPDTSRSARSRRRTTSSGSRRSATACSPTTTANPDFIQPESRRNEIVNLVKSGLQDVSITRKGFTWGIPVPFDPEQTIYVWFDALLNYITADRLRQRRGTVPPALAGRRPRDRQGHHAVPLRPLAGHADVGRAAAAEAGLRPRVRLQQGGEDQQVGRDRDRPDGRLPASTAPTPSATTS